MAINSELYTRIEPVSPDLNQLQIVFDNTVWPDMWVARTKFVASCVTRFHKRTHELFYEQNIVTIETPPYATPQKAKDELLNEIERVLDAQ